MPPVTTKLISHFYEFSVILYEFSKVVVNSVKGEDAFYTRPPATFERLTTRSSFLSLGPLDKRNKIKLRPWLVGVGLSADRRRDRTGGVAGNGEELTRVLLSYTSGSGMNEREAGDGDDGIAPPASGANAVQGWRWVGKWTESITETRGSSWWCRLGGRRIVVAWPHAGGRIFSVVARSGTSASLRE